MNFPKRIAIILFVALASALAIGAIPRSTPILHVSPERWEGSSAVVQFNGTTAPTINSGQIAISHTTNDGGTGPLAIDMGLVTLADGGATFFPGQSFAWPPVCTCSDTFATPAACSVLSSTTSTVVLQGLANSAHVLNVTCMGLR